MAARTYDVTIYGATGFTGQCVAAEALRVFPASTRIAVAGRSTAKLQALVATLDARDRLAVLGQVDVSDEASLEGMVRGTRLLLNCVGPYRLYGQPVFAAAAAAGTDYLDLCGEPEFIERMELRYGPVAQRTGALMSCAAGVDSIPADLGVLFAARAFQPPAVPSRVDAVLQLRAPLGTRVHYATWQAAVHGFGSVGELRALRREAAAAGLHPAPKLLGPRPPPAAGPVWDERAQAYTLPFPGADASVVRRTQSALSAAGLPAVHFSVRFAVPSRLALLRFLGYGGLMSLLASWSWGRRLLLAYPGLFSGGLVSHEGPTREQMAAARCCFRFTAAGYSQSPAAGATAGPPDQQVTAEVAFGDPGYLYTAVMMCQAAATLLQERPRLEATVGTGGGVFTVGALFRDSSLIQCLDAAGVTFRLL